MQFFCNGKQVSKFSERTYSYCVISKRDRTCSFLIKRFAENWRNCTWNYS